MDYRNNTEPYDGDYNVYSTTAFTNRAKELINDHDVNEPMFMYLSYQAPHSPSQVLASVYLTRYIRSCVLSLEHNSAKVSNLIKEL